MLVLCTSCPTSIRQAYAHLRNVSLSMFSHRMNTTGFVFVEHSFMQVHVESEG